MHKRSCVCDTCINALENAIRDIANGSPKLLALLSERIKAERASE